MVRSPISNPVSSYVVRLCGLRKKISISPPIVGTWLLVSGSWNDSGVWDSAAIWNDGA